MLRKILEVGVAVALVVGMASCIATNSLNVQRSALRGAGDGGMTAVLENQDADEVTAVAEGVQDVCKEILDFLDTGYVSDLTKGELKRELLDIVSGSSSGFVNDILNLVSVVNVDTQKIGKRNVKRIRASINGVLRGAEEYAVEDRD